MQKQIDLTQVTIRPSSIVEAWTVGLESDEFRPLRNRMADDRNGRCVWGVFRTVCQRAGMIERETLDAMLELRDVERAAARSLGFGAIAEANDADVNWLEIARALRQSSTESERLGPKTQALIHQGKD